MSVYIPRFETQRDEAAPTPWTNCTPASAAMLVRQWTWGQLDTTDVTIRRASPVPLSRGMNFAEVSAALESLHPGLGPMQYSEADGTGTANVDWAFLREWLAADGGAVVCGNYSSLAGLKSATGLALNRWQPGGAFGHAVFVCDYQPSSADGDGSLVWMDPLGHGDYAGDRTSLDHLWRFIWRNGNGPDARVTAAYAFARPRPPRASFSDVPPTHWAYGAVEWAVANGLVRGTAAGRFDPDRPTTRAETVVMLGRLVDLFNPSKESES